MIDWKEHAQQPVSNEEQLDVISELTKEMLDLENEIKKREDELKELNKQYKHINQGSLPEAMLALGLTSITHSSGKKLNIKTFYQASIDENNRYAAFKYLEDTGNDSLIKTELTCKFGKGESETASKIFEMISEQPEMRDNLPSMKTGVHPQTLKAFVREQIESGVEGFPLDTFNVYIGNKVEVK